MTRALVTGCAGFVGSHLVDRLLAEGWQVVGIDAFTDSYPRARKTSHLAQALRHPAFRLVEGDLLALPLADLLDESLAGDDVIFHLAARAGVRSSWGDGFDDCARNNVLATQRLLEACRDRRLGRFVLASSSSIYGDAARLPTPEDTAPRPLSPYGVTKAAAEQLCAVYARGFGVPVVTLRYFSVYGPRQRPDMAFHVFIERALAGDPVPILGDGRQARDFTCVDDAVDATIAAAGADVVGETINVSGGGRASVLEVLDALEEILETPIRRVSCPAPPGEARDTAADLEKAARRLGYRPRTALAEGLRRQVAWRQAQGAP